MPFKYKDQEKKYHKEYHAKWYQENQDKIKKIVEATKKRKHDWFRKLKENYPCDNCGVFHTAIIEFHHKDPKKKKFSVASYQSKSKKDVLAEIKKCTPLCKNCHAILHWNERDK